MIAKVAIDLALDRLFTYEVPDALEKKLAVGQLLCVPFGHREARGFLLEIAEKKEDDVHKLKPITTIVDETPFFSVALLQLVKRVAAYTASPIETVLRTALPAAVLKRTARAKEQLFVEPAVRDEPVACGETGASDAARESPQMTARLRWLHEQIVRLDGGWMRSLCDELKTTPASLRQLAAHGLIQIVPRARRRNPLDGRRILPTRPLPLNDEQSAALDTIVHAVKPVLLFGVTGSGKTEVYLQAIARELDNGRGAIVMVPEIALTPQTVQRFASRFGNRVAVLHSALSDGERYDEWHRIRAGEARVVVGPRSAVWAPVRDLGLIVVDEEHETSYKQDETPRYQARDVAVLRGAVEGAKVVLGSATPSLESWMNVARGKYVRATLHGRAGAGTMPRAHIVDMTREGGMPMEGRGRIFSKDLLDAISLRLQRHEQTILFLNRRGYSRSVMCENCGFVVTCPACDLPYTYHRADSCLRCHICGGWIPVPETCPQCKSHALTFKGIGTQRAEAALKTCFPQAKVLRMDADSTSRKHSHQDILDAFGRLEGDILIGTQMIAKGLDFKNVTLVGILNADSSLALAGSDFRAAERTFQLLAQVSGRAGRAELPGEVFIQTYDPEVSVLKCAARADYEGFAKTELKERSECKFPPFVHLSTVNFKSQNLQLVGDWAVMYAKSLQAYARRGGLLVSDAIPSALEKADGWYRWQIVLRAPSNAAIVAAWRWISQQRPPPKNLRVALDADAYNLV